MTTASPPLAFREFDAKGKLTHVNYHRGQSQAWDALERIIAMLGGTQSGKTCFGPEWMDREIQLCGNEGDFLAVTATFPLLDKKMLPEFRYVFERLKDRGVWRESDKVFTSHERIHGAEAWRVIFGSAKNPESIESATAKAAWLDEAGQVQFKRDAWEAINRRLSLSMGRILVTTTPYEWGWFKAEIYDRRNNHPDPARRDPNIRVIHMDSIDNPVFPREEWTRMQGLLPRWKFNMFYRGLFERPAGQIYSMFDSDRCRVPRFDLPPSWPRYVGHDFGPDHMAAVWYAENPTTGLLYVYRAYHAGELTAYAHAKEFQRLSEGETITRRVGGIRSEQGWREAFGAAGWPISLPRVTGPRSVDLGITQVQGLHQQNRILVFDDVLEYLDEKMSYSWELDEQLEPRMGVIKNKNDYHLMDAERYLVVDFTPEREPGANRTAKVQTI